MRLAGKEKLHRRLGRRHDSFQLVHVAQDQVGALVRRETSCESDQQDIGVEHVIELPELARRTAVTGELIPQPPARDFHQAILLDPVRLPQVGSGRAVHRLGERLDR